MEFLLENMLPYAHTYSFASTGIKTKSKIFNSRQDANKYMYKLCKKHGLKVIDVWKDNHDVTHVCEDGIKFYIHRI